MVAREPGGTRCSVLSACVDGSRQAPVATPPRSAVGHATEGRVGTSRRVQSAVGRKRVYGNRSVHWGEPGVLPSGAMDVRLAGGGSAGRRTTWVWWDVQFVMAALARRSAEGSPERHRCRRANLEARCYQVVLAEAMTKMGTPLWGKSPNLLRARVSRRPSPARSGGPQRPCATIGGAMPTGSAEPLPSGRGAGRAPRPRRARARRLR